MQRDAKAEAAELSAPASSETLPGNGFETAIAENSAAADDLSKLPLGELLVEALAQFIAVVEARARVVMLETMLAQFEGIAERHRVLRAEHEAEASKATLQ